MIYRDLLFEREDGSQVLVTIWAEEPATMAERPDGSAVWGPPVDVLRDSVKERL